MPCMGPTPPTEKEIEAAFNDIMQVLKEKHGIFSFTEDQLIDHHPRPFVENRRKVLGELKKAIEKVLEQEGFETF